MPQPIRPLSPHLQIYRPQWTTMLSILHRLTGIALAIGLLMLTWFLCALASGPESFFTFTNFAGSPLGVFMLMGWSFALCYHALSGVRHLIFDTGRMLKIEQAEMAGKIMLATAILLTLGLWACVFGS